MAMANVVLYPQSSYSVGESWISAGGALAQDSDYALSPLGPNTLRLYNFTTGLPKNINITGITVGGHAFVASALANTTLSAWLSYNGYTPVSVTKTTTGLSTTETLFLLGSATDLWGFTPKRPHIDGNQDFSVIVYSSGASGVINLNDIYLVVDYTAASYLNGERSDFPAAPDTINLKANGTGLEHQVTSESVNKLGDYLVNIETQLLSTLSQANAWGFPPGVPMALVAITVTGTVVSGSVWVDFHALKANPYSSTVTLTNTQMTGVQGVRPPFASVVCDFVSAVGWVIQGANTYPVFVSPRSLLIEKRNIGTAGNPIYGYRYSFGFTAIGQNLVGTRTSSSNNGYNGVYILPDAVNTGILIVKLLGAARI